MIPPKLSIDKDIPTITSSSSSSHTDSSLKTTAWGPILGVAFAGTTIAGTLLLTAPFVLQYMRSPLPYMATPKDKIQKALQFIETRRLAIKSSSRGSLHTMHQNEEGRHFVDLGSGDGETIYQALALGRNGCNYTKATGIELNSTLWAMSQIRRWLFWTAEERKRCNFLWMDMFTYDLRQNNADTVMIFGVKPLMVSISQKLARECHEGTHILAYRFPLPLMADADGDLTEKGKSNEDTTLLNAKLVYDQEEMRIYECIGTTSVLSM